MNPYEFVIAIIMIVAVVSVVKARRRDGSSTRTNGQDREGPIDGEKEMLRAEVRELKNRVAVLERIVTDRSSTLEQEIERLREPQG